MLTRRHLLATSTATLAMPSIARAAGSNVLRFIPLVDLTVLDPMVTTAYATRNSALMVFDTLYGLDATYSAQPQMVSGHVVDDGGKRWRLTLRAGLKFHDGTPVLARDCVASIKRWGMRDSVGQTLLTYVDDIDAPDDKTIQFRLNRPFALLPEMLGKVGSSICAIMPERLARTDPYAQIPELVGSGPFRFVADERVVGSQVVYEKNADYVPRDAGPLQWTSGPKRVFVDRVEWHVIPDAATAAAAMQRKEMDWWEIVPSDMMPVLKGVTTSVTDPTGWIGSIRMNELLPPFDNPAIRRVLLKVFDQEDFMTAVAGDDPAFRHTPTGFFCPGLPMATDVGLEVFTGKRDYDGAKRALIEAGYKGERIVVLGSSDLQNVKALGDVLADTLQRVGFNVDYQISNFGTVVVRHNKKEPLDQGGWNILGTFWSGLDQASPANNAFLRATGDSGVWGWPKSEKLETMRQQWLDAPDVAAQRILAADIQRQALVDLPYIPVGQYFFSTAYQNNITGVLNGPPIFWNVRKT